MYKRHKYILDFWYQSALQNFSERFGMERLNDSMMNSRVVINGKQYHKFTVWSITSWVSLDPGL